MKNLKGRPNTIRAKESLYRNWIAPFLADDGSNLDEAVTTWQTDLAPATVKVLLYLGKEHVRDETGIELDIKEHVKRVGRSQQQMPPKALNKEEISRLSACIDSVSPLHLAYHLALNTGCRRGEVMGLKWEDVDFLKGQILVSRSYNGPTKSGKSRIIPLSPALEKVLLAKLGWKSYNDGRTKRSGCIIKSTFDPNPYLKRFCREAGVKEITFHGLRHSFATLALDAGKSPVLVSRVLGHATVATTLSVYWNATNERLDMDFLE